MPLTKTRGNMYDWVTHMHTHIRGACSHRCPYCYVQKGPGARMGHYAGALRLEEKELLVSYGQGKIIFLEHMNDLFAADVPPDWQRRILAHARQWPCNKYIIQTKNPASALLYLLSGQMPANCAIGTTIETNRPVEKSAAPPAEIRAKAMSLMPDPQETFITIEPIMDFDLEEMLPLIEEACPDWVNIGADSKGAGLPEPSRAQVAALIQAINDKGFKIRNKTNLDRILNQ